MSTTRRSSLRRKDPLRVGYLPFTDCAPIVYAQEGALFAKYGLEVELQRGSSPFEMCNKLVQGQLDAVHAPATLPFVANLERESDDSACVTSLVLSLQGNAIIISRQLFDDGIRENESLRAQIYRTWGKRTFRFGVPSLFSSQSFLLQKWLTNIVPATAVRLIVVPPAQMFPTLKLGYIDGFCASEPWASVAVQAGAGVCVATSAELAPLHPEKVLTVRQSFALGRGEEHELLIAALLEACAYCDVAENRPVLAEMLAQPHYVNAPVDCLLPALTGAPVRNEHSGEKSVVIFHRHRANEPNDEKAFWLIGHLYQAFEQTSPFRGGPRRTPVLNNVFRRETFERAQARINGPAASAEPFKPAEIARPVFGLAVNCHA
jgi:ABC-type nitrate/sulfonate/bicarbonate transport system substrate-binding protein